jgi:putative tricarboxylic transport membrane protein
MADGDETRNSPAGRWSQDAGAGLFLIAIGLIGFWQSLPLAAGSLSQLGPGMLPRAISVLVAVCGVALFLEGWFAGGERLERWAVRGPVFILGAVVVFALTVRPLGLAVAGPLAVALSGFASRETHWLETIAFGVAMTVFCLGLFKFALGLPIPVAPWLLGW